MDNRLTRKSAIAGTFSLPFSAASLCFNACALAVLVIMLFIAGSKLTHAQNEDLESLLDLYPEQTAQQATPVRAVHTAFAKAKIAEVEAAATFKVVRSTEKWDFVRFVKPTVPVWVSKEYLRISAGLAEVTASRLNGRLRPSISAPILIGINRGYVSPVLESTNGFAKIKAPASLIVTLPRNDDSTAQTAQVKRQAVPVTSPNSSNGAASDNGATQVRQVNQPEPRVAQPSTQNQNAASTNVNTSLTDDRPSESLDDQAGQATASGQATAPGPVPAPQSSVPAALPSSSEQSHLIAPGDAISLFVFGEPDLSATNVRVPQSGNVSLPLIGSVPVAGKTIREIEQQVRAILSQGYVKNPRLSVSIFSYRPIFIRGAVRTTGAFPYSEGLTVAKALALAGGTKNSAQAQGVSVIRDGQTVESGLSLDSQYTVASGDVLSISEEAGVSEDATLFIYLHGEVASPGEYLFRRGLTVEKAIVLAGGFTLRASKKKVHITRYNGIGENEEPTKMRSVELYTAVEPGDVISVGARWF